jgi:hypothetical protein
MILIFVSYKVEVMENETYTQVVFFYDKFVCDDEVDFQKDFQGNKNLSQVMYLSINDSILSLLPIPYFGASFIHKSP